MKDKYHLTKFKKKAYADFSKLQKFCSSEAIFLLLFFLNKNY